MKSSALNLETRDFSLDVPNFTLPIHVRMFHFSVCAFNLCEGYNPFTLAEYRLFQESLSLDFLSLVIRETEKVDCRWVYEPRIEFVVLISARKVLEQKAKFLGLLKKQN